jgi:NADH dehydrogenase [ubiquinone] 1 alpha subcomplex assembly factor 5
MSIEPNHPGPAGLLVFDRRLIAARRGRAAASADAHDFLLQHVADEIADRLSVVRRQFDTALVLGAQNGGVGRLLRTLPSIGLVVEAESAPRMLRRCGRPKVLADEEALPFRDGSLGLVVAPLTLQWTNDVPGVLAQVRRALKPDGLLLGAMLGGRTLTELRESLLAAEAECEGGASPRVAPFVDVRDAGALLQRAGFALPVADSDTLDATYATPLDLMAELRGMGATNALVARRRVPLRRSTLMRAVEIYIERFSDGNGRIRATFEIVWLTGWAPHASQQKPLAPGSARTRLADALGVPEQSGGDKAGEG